MFLLLDLRQEFVEALIDTILQADEHEMDSNVFEQDRVYSDFVWRPDGFEDNRDYLSKIR